MKKTKGQAPQKTLKRKASVLALEGEDPTIEPLSPPEGSTVPRFSTKIHFNRRLFVVKVILQKIPMSCLQLEATDDTFELDSRKFTKKYFLKFPYPQNIRVNAAEGKPVFDGNELTCTFPITQIFDRETGKLLRKKQKTENDTDIVAANFRDVPVPKKQKAKKKKNLSSPMRKQK